MPKYKRQTSAQKAKKKQSANKTLYAASHGIGNYPGAIPTSRLQPPTLQSHGVQGAHINLALQHTHLPQPVYSGPAGTPQAYGHMINMQWMPPTQMVPSHQARNQAVHKPMIRTSQPYTAPNTAPYPGQMFMIPQIYSPTTALGTTSNLTHYFHQQHMLYSRQTHGSTPSIGAFNSMSAPPLSRSIDAGIPLVSSMDKGAGAGRSLRQSKNIELRNPATGNIHIPTTPLPLDKEFTQVINNIRSDLNYTGKQGSLNPSTTSKRKRNDDLNSTAPAAKRLRHADCTDVTMELASPGTSRQGEVARNQCRTKKHGRKPLTPTQKESMRKYIRGARSNPEYRKMENQRRLDHYYNDSGGTREDGMTNLIQHFHQQTALGPMYICISCDRLCYKHATVRADKILDKAEPNTVLCATGAASAEGSKWVCHSCNNYLKDNRVPPMALANGNGFPEKPAHLDLHQLEWRLVAPRLVFMKIHRAPMGRQLKIEGNVVNVIADVANTVSRLPRCETNTETIPIKLKRNENFTSHTLAQNVRPNKVHQAAQWLTENGPLYRSQGIVLDSDWTRHQAMVKKQREDSRQKKNAVVREAEKDHPYKYKCDFTTCTFLAKHEDIAMAHMTTIHNGVLALPQEGYPSSNVLVILIHQRQKKDNELGETWCTICSSKVSRLQSASEHMLMYHTIPKTAPCWKKQAPHNEGCIQWTYDEVPSNEVIRMRPAYLPSGCKPISIAYPTQNVNAETISSDTLHEGRIHSPVKEFCQPDNTANADKDIQPTSGNLTTASENLDNENGNISDPDDEADAAGCTDTMLSQNTYMETSEIDGINDYAPGQRSKPQSIFLDKYCEELAYPDIYLGHQRPDKRLTTCNYSAIVKSELLQTDRRAATNVENLFFKTKKLQMKLLTGRTQLALRQHKTSDLTITAGDLKDTSNIKRIIQHDQGYKFLATLRGSPPYFEKAKKDIFAMIRQLGPATFFVSLSAAETRWTHLLRVIGMTVDKKSYTDEEITKMPWPEKCRLIQSDPVSCARHFDHTLRTFITQFLKSKHAPIGELLDYFYRVEMQHRGSCHVHMLVWINQAPSVTGSPIEDITQFIDKYVTCSAADPEDATFSELVGRQRHAHTKTCRPTPGAKCRFGYPQPPMPETVMLEPLDQEDEQYEEKTAHWKKIRAKLDEMKGDNDIPFNEFLTTMGLTYDEYKTGLQAGVKARTIFLKRKTSEISINNYNTDCLRAWRANMDIQYIVDAYACATYIVSYMSKGCRGMSKLLRTACKEANEGNNTLIDQMRHIGNKFLNAVEISAQEAAYIALQLALRQSSRTCIFVNTSPPNERVRLLKPCQELDQMDDNDTNIDSSNILKRYSQREKSLEKTCLAEWVSWYDCRKQREKEPSAVEDIDGTPLEEDNHHDNDNPDDIPLLDESETDQPKQRRKRARILRCPWFNVTQAPEKHYRELIMLFIPWRDEDKELLASYGTYYEHYQAKKEMILELLEQYSPGRAAVEEAYHTINSMEEEEVENTAVATYAQHENANAEILESRCNEPTFVPTYDIGQDLGVIIRSLPNLEELLHNQVGNQTFRENVRSLNPKQRAFFDYISSSVQTNREQLMLFLSGGAGVGKTMATNTIYQQLLRIYNRDAGDDFESLKILVMAPTGKAAHLINGSTIHSALHAPFNRIEEDYIPMSISTLNTARAKLGKVKFIIIDEISMVGNNMFNFVSRRLQDILGVRQPFGGCHVLCVGDLFQLRPVADRWIYLNSPKGKGPLTPNLWKLHFKLYELTQIMRQRDHHAFAELLNRLREGNQTTADINFLKSKVLKKDFTDTNYQHKGLIHLFNMNDDVDSFNLIARQNKAVAITAKDQISGSCNKSMEEAHLNNLRKKKQKDTMGLATTLTLALEDRIEISINIDISDGLTNGASGRVMGLPGVSSDSSCLASGYIWILFDSHYIGRQARKRNAHIYPKDIPRQWTPINPIKKQISISKKSELHAIRIQFPIRCAAAKTIHRSQGQTLSSVVADFRGTQGPHKHYVAISRVTDPSQLFITNLNEGRIHTADKTTEEMRRLRTDCAVQIPNEMRYFEPSTETHILYFNISSLHKYCEDLEKDYTFQRSQLVCITETHMKPRTDLTTITETHPFQVHHKPREHWDTGSAKHGVSIFSKQPLTCPRLTTTNTLEAIACEVSDLQLSLVVVYRYHRRPARKFFKHLQRIIDGCRHPTLYIGGDINMDYKNKGIANRIKKDLLDNNSLTQLVSTSTIKSGSIIDHVYTNTTNSSAKVLYTYYSDHNMILTTVPDL